MSESEDEVPLVSLAALKKASPNSKRYVPWDGSENITRKKHIGHGRPCK